MKERTLDGFTGMGLPILLTTAEVAESLRVDPATLSPGAQAASGRGSGGWRLAFRVTCVTTARRGWRRPHCERAQGAVGAVSCGLKSGRSYVAGRTFDTKREAQAWLARERAALAGGIDPRAGRSTVRTLLPVWLEERRTTVSAKTYTTYAALPRLVPTALAALNVGTVTGREVQRTLVVLTRDGYAEASVRRFRASLSSFFAWAVRERMIAVNPVIGTRVPRAKQPTAEMYPFSEVELEGVYAKAVSRLAAAGGSSRLADIMLVAAWTGLRWSELRAIRVRDFAEVPMPLLVVQRAEPEGTSVKTTKSGKGRGGSRWLIGSCPSFVRWPPAGAAKNACLSRRRVTDCTRRHSSGPWAGRRFPRAGASTICGTRRPACGWHVGSTR